jgi:hypothetical protein
MVPKVGAEKMVESEYGHDRAVEDGGMGVRVSVGEGGAGHVPDMFSEHGVYIVISRRRLSSRYIY